MQFVLLQTTRGVFKDILFSFQRQYHCRSANFEIETRLSEVRSSLKFFLNKTFYCTSQCRYLPPLLLLPLKFYINCIHITHQINKYLYFHVYYEPAFINIWIFCHDLCLTIIYLYIFFLIITIHFIISLQLLVITLLLHFDHTFILYTYGITKICIVIDWNIIIIGTNIDLDNTYLTCNL